MEKHSLMWVAGLGVAVLSGAGTAAYMGRMTVPPKAAAAIALCAECGVIESTRSIEPAGESSGLGAAGGAIAGGLLGSEAGVGDGRKIMAVQGAVDGAIAGDEMEKQVRGKRNYEITIRFEDGSSGVITEAHPPAWRRGARVRVVDGAIQPNA